MSEEHMSKERSDSVIDILQSKLGTRYRSSMEQGRADIVRVLSDELSMERDQADVLVSRMIEGGQLRYVTADERDPEVDREAQHDERSDRAYEVGEDRRGTTDNAVTPGLMPPGGGPQAATSGMTTGAAAPAMASGTGAPAAGPLAVAAATGQGVADAGGRHGGYWDICSDAAGVQPSRFRKGQVEPRGT